MSNKDDFWATVEKGKKSETETSQNPSENGSVAQAGASSDTPTAPAPAPTVNPFGQPIVNKPAEAVPSVTEQAPEAEVPMKITPPPPKKPIDEIPSPFKSPNSTPFNATSSPIGDKPTPFAPTPAPVVEPTPVPEIAPVQTPVPTVTEPIAPQPTPAPQPAPQPVVASPFPAPASPAPIDVSTQPIGAPAVLVPQPHKIPTGVVTVSDPFGNKNEVVEDEFDFSPANVGEGLDMMIYGNKGSGKTVLALSVEGSIACISLDQQSKIIHRDFYDADPRIEVWDGVRYFNSVDPDTKTSSAVKTVKFLQKLITEHIAKLQPDWIVIDGTERLTHICEMAMRGVNNIPPYDGFKNFNLWKMRNDFMNEIHRVASQVAKKGVIYTAYVDIKTVTKATGDEVREGPKWAGDIEQKTRVVIKVEGDTLSDGREFYATVESSKVRWIPTAGRKVVGRVYNNGKVDKIGMKNLLLPKEEVTQTV